MRIIAGSWRGRRLANVGKGDDKSHLRPTTDRIRESLFAMLEGGRFDDPITDANVLDLFAGTGALGLEALSRGAQHATFVEKNRAGLSLLRENLDALQANAQILARDATRLPKGKECNLVFLDPPYGLGLGNKSLDCAARQSWLAKGALIVWEENAPQTPPDHFELLEAKRFGDTWITFLSYAP